ncbi:hypothetical protein GCM10010400_45020 [Streptomyces aculeolatus]|uniref:FxsB family cyclophane-forming radical SAM/SPASM peptide maturase n=1 Tax=Streptomyces aculeolatus TaxID=270689 RepID=UPI001CED23C9|nr:FxsB family cyclophane-forming radical SAM/SPASM peptide maturase [Streptomyces aculeolatus]
MTELPIVDIAAAGREWPTPDLVSRVRADGTWQPLPFREFIVKVHGRCNLACDYCYMYEMADQSWRTKPVLMNRATLDQVAARLGEHLAVHAEDLQEVTVKMHGGEALLVGADELDRMAGLFRAAGPPGVVVNLAVTTNGILLDDPRILEVLYKHGIRVNVSLDGDRRAHDRHRVYANGRGSHEAVLRGLSALCRPPYNSLLNVLLCTIDIANDPIDVYESLVAVGAPYIEFELPLGNWSDTPPGWDARRTAYAEWLIQIFDRWYDTVPLPTVVRSFENIMALVLGGRSRTEGYGIGTFQTLTVETDGSIELVDSLKSTFGGAPDTGLDVFRDSFDAARFHPGVVARQIGPAALADECNACSIRDICGGGEYSHRYRRGRGFRNPSVYCADLTELIVHIRDRVRADMRRRDMPVGGRQD